MPSQNPGFLPSVLLIHNHYRIPGGEDTVFSAERDLLQSHGHRVIVYERTNAEPAGAWQKLTMALSALYNRRAAREVRALIRREKPDIVHIHNTLLCISPSVFRAAKAEGVPVVMTLHNFRLLCPNGILMRDGHICEDCPQRGLLCAVKHKCYRGSTAQSLVVAAMLALHRRLGTWQGVWAIAPTEFDREKFLQYNRKLKLLTPERLLVKPHAAACAVRPPLPISRRRGWLFAGRLEELKGILPLLQAWKLLAWNEPLFVAGDGPQSTQCSFFAHTNGLENVRFLGRLAPEVLTEYQRRVKAVIVPSLCYESFGLAAAESLMQGTPVLGSDLGNIGAMIRPGQNGLRFAAGDPRAMAEAVQKLNEMLPTLCPKAIQSHAAAQFAPQQNYHALLQIYRRALQAQQEEP